MRIHSLFKGSLSPAAPGGRLNYDIRVVEADGRSIVLFNTEGTFYAIDNTCTHRGGPLGEGKLNGESVTCPWHGADFNVKTGAVTRPPAGTGVRSFVVKVEAGDVLVKLE